MMETRYGPVKLKVPKGFPVLLQRFAREVIREQPDDIVAFGAKFFETLVVERKVTGEDPLECDPFDKPGFHAPPKPLRPISSKIRQKEIEQEKAATKIQANYRGFQVRKASVTRRRQQEEQKKEKAAIKIQAHYRGFQTRKSISQPAKVESNEEGKDALEQVGEEDELAKQDEHNSDAEPSEEKPPSPTGNMEETVNPEGKDSGDEKEIASEEKNDGGHPETDDLKEQEAAAVKIQAVFRGHKSRKQLQEKEDQKEDPKTYSKDEEEAAVKIQASFRGYTSRKQLHEKNTLRNSDKPEDEAKKTIQDKGYDVHDDYSHQQREEAAAVKIQATFRGHKTRKQLSESKNQNRVEQSYPDEESVDNEAPREENTRESQDENAAPATSQKDDDIHPVDPVVQDEAADGYEAGKDASEQHDNVDEQVQLSQEEELTAGDSSEDIARKSPTDENESEKYSYSNEAVESSQEDQSAGDPKDDSAKESPREETPSGTPAPEEAKDESKEQDQDKIESSPVHDPIVDAMDEAHQDEAPQDVAEKDEVEEQVENRETTELSEKNDLSAHDANDDVVKEADRVQTKEDGGDLSESTKEEATGGDYATSEVQDVVPAVSPQDE